MPARLTMICSGATAATRRGSFPLDEPLEQRSLQQAAALGKWLRRADHVLVSPALRAGQTAAALSLRAVETAALRDQDFGDWAGKSLAEIQEMQPDGMAAWLSDPCSAPHGGESLADLSRRVSALMDDLLGDRGHMVAVTHAAVIRAAILHVLGAPLNAFWRIDIDPLSVAEFSSDGRRWTLRTANVAAKPKGRASLPESGGASSKSS